jgi:hypothetical protein
MKYSCHSLFLYLQSPLTHLRPSSPSILASCHLWNSTKFRLNSSESESYATTDGQSASLSWNKAPIWGLRTDMYYPLTITVLLLWGTLSDERTPPVVMCLLTRLLRNCFFLCCVLIRFRGNVFTELLSSNWRLLWFYYSSFRASCHIIRVVNLRRMKWEGYAARISAARNACRTWIGGLNGRLISRCIFGGFCKLLNEAFSIWTVCRRMIG